MCVTELSSLATIAHVVVEVVKEEGGYWLTFLHLKYFFYFV